MDTKNFTPLKIGTELLKDHKIKELQKILNDDMDLVSFFLVWMRNGHNSTQAYLTLHPNVTYESATVLGSRRLAKVSIPAIMETYGIGFEKYFTKLEEGLEATKVVSARIIMKKGDESSKEGDLPEATSRTDDFVEVPDFAVRKQYHDKQGRLLEIEKDPRSLIQVNTQVNQATYYDFAPDQKREFNQVFDEWFEEKYRRSHKST